MSDHCIRLCRLGELEAGTAKRFDVEGLAIAVVRVGDEVFAIGDRCTHQNVSLSEGEVDEEELVLECWKYGSQFSLVTGEPFHLPALGPTPVHQVELSDGEVSPTLQ